MRLFSKLLLATLITSQAAQADICVHLTSNNIGSAAEKTIYQLTVIGESFKQDILVSPPIAKGGEYYFRAKDLSQLRSLKVKTFTLTRTGLLKLTCNDMNIEIPAVASLMYVDQDNSDAGVCLLSATPLMDPISPCHKN